MRDPARIDRVVGKLCALWHAYPDQRLGQLVLNIVRQTQGTTAPSMVFNLEDDDLEASLDDIAKNGF